MILRAAITNRVTRTVSGIDRDYAPVCADLQKGWTVTAPEEFADRPNHARLIGRRYAYIAVLDEGQLVLIGARARRAWDSSEAGGWPATRVFMSRSSKATSGWTRRHGRS